jgi:hypothetical protein
MTRDLTKGLRLHAIPGKYLEKSSFKLSKYASVSEFIPAAKLILLLLSSRRDKENLSGSYRAVCCRDSVLSSCVLSSCVLSRQCVVEIVCYRAVCCRDSVLSSCVLSRQSLVETVCCRAV